VQALQSLHALRSTSGRATQPRRFGKFEILATVGSGAFGSLYKARDPSLDRFIAMKIPGLCEAARPWFFRAHCKSVP
jgi:hypothetical protein